MRVIDYVFGQSVVVDSPLPVDEVQSRINGATPSVFWPFASGVKGKALLGRIRLSFTELWFFDYSAKPILAGKLVDTFGSTRLEAKFGAPVFSLVFFALWYFLLTLMAVGIFVTWLNDGLEPGGRIVFPVLCLLLLAPALLHYGLTRKAHNDLEAILDFLASEADFEIENWSAKNY
uniref:hypothetical protein n=1 Tax=Parerythrobacter lutipelagi TaxID=1964208 RepID=UPI0010F70734|nr:hypothetical protein [Parerythrobacter lutipelagi]